MTVDSVEFKVEAVGSFYKKADKTAIPGASPPLLNNNPSLYGCLETPLDMRRGCENFQDTGYDEKFEAFSDYLMKTFEKGSSLKKSLNADFLSNRRNFLTIAMAMYYSDEEHEIQAVRYKGIIFLNNWKRNSPDSSYAGGYKFELYMTLDEHGEPFDDFKPADNSECSRVVFRSTVESDQQSISMCYAAEIDAMYSDGSFVELKTISLNYNQWQSRRSLGHYMQALFGKCQCVIYGEKARGARGFVDKVYKKLVGMIPEECAEYWNKDVCMQTLFSTLQKIKNELKNDGDSLLLTVHDGRVEMKLEEGKVECDFFSKEFMDHFC